MALTTCVAMTVYTTLSPVSVALTTCVAMTVYTPLSSVSIQKRSADVLHYFSFYTQHKRENRSLIPYRNGEVPPVVSFLIRGVFLFCFVFCFFLKGRGGWVQIWDG